MNKTDYPSYRSIRVLHVASFTGNIGDTINHKGAEKLRELYLDFRFEITRKEIREFYWGEWRFNSEEFVSQANSFDLLMIGGGNYFELWVEGSATGSTIDIARDYLDKIRTPILFYSLGCDIGQGASEENIARFGNFLDYATASDRFFLSVRNDGAMPTIKSLFGNRYENSIREIPDGAFFAEIQRLHHHCEVEETKVNILINLAGDMPDIRFGKSLSEIRYDEFVKAFAAVLESLDASNSVNTHFIFALHIFRDIQVVNDVLHLLPDKIRRRSLAVAPYVTGVNGADYIFSLYNRADLILGMRFHANIFGYALRKNVIGLVNYPQIEKLYAQLGSREFVRVNISNFEELLLSKIYDHIENRNQYESLAADILTNVQDQAKIEYQLLNKWLESHYPIYTR